MWQLVCTNPKCPDQGVMRDVDLDAIRAENEAAGAETGPVFCSCGTDITATAREKHAEE